MKQYKVYAKKLQNNIGNEAELIGIYPAMRKSEAISMAMNDYSNRGIYNYSTFFAMVEKDK